jgi:hypothetical protein
VVGGGRWGGWGGVGGGGGEDGGGGREVEGGRREKGMGGAHTHTTTHTITRFIAEH